MPTGTLAELSTINLRVAECLSSRKSSYAHAISTVDNGILVIKKITTKIDPKRAETRFGTALRIQAKVSIPYYNLHVTYLVGPGVDIWDVLNFY